MTPSYFQICRDHFSLSAMQHAVFSLYILSQSTFLECRWDTGENAEGNKHTASEDETFWQATGAAHMDSNKTGNIWLKTRLWDQTSQVAKSYYFQYYDQVNILIEYLVSLLSCICDFPIRINAELYGDVKAHI